MRPESGFQTEGFDTSDLLAARPLLKELRLGHPAA
jgi:hypothetical protein